MTGLSNIGGSLSTYQSKYYGFLLRIPVILSAQSSVMSMLINTAEKAAKINIKCHSACQISGDVVASALRECPNG